MIRKRTLFLAILSMSCAYSMYSSAPSFRDAYQALTASRTRTVAAGLLAWYATYSAYYYWCHRSIKNRAQQTPAQPIEHYQETVWIFVPGIADNHKQLEKYLMKNSPNGFVPDNALVCTFDDACNNIR